MQTSRDRPGYVRDIRKHTRADTPRNLTDPFKIDRARIRRRATHKQLRTMLFRNPLQLVVIDLLRLSGNTVVSDLVTDSRKIHRMTVRQMPAVRQTHSENLIAVLNSSEINGHVGLRATVRLHVRMFGPKQFFGAVNRGLFYDVGPLTTAVISFAGITFGILVREHRTGSFKHSFT